MRKRNETKLIAILISIGVAILLITYAFEYLDPLVSVVFSVLVLLIVAYYSVKIWKARR